MPEPAVRTLDEVRGLLLRRAETGRNPFSGLSYEHVAPSLERLSSLEPDHWAEVFMEPAPKHEERAIRARRDGHLTRARDEYLLAYSYYRIARYPSPRSTLKREAYERSVALFREAAALLKPPAEPVRIPFKNGGVSREIACYLRKPADLKSPPLVVVWGGVDGYKEDHARLSDAYMDAGLATLVFDMPGVGESPLKFMPDASLWDCVLDWVAKREDLDADRIAVAGSSTGGYYATMVAHTCRERIRAAVNHGGPAHYAFEADWIHQAQNGEYPFELAETLACAAGVDSFQGWLDHAPSLSLLRQGILDEPCAPLLLVNGVKDTVFPIRDMYLLMEHGSPKTGRFYPRGHMAPGPGTRSTIIAWLRRELYL